jgi:hypothetical protein
MTRTPQRKASKVATIFVAFALFGLAITGLWLAFGNAGTAADASLPDLARIECGADGVNVETPRVRVNSDGIHLLVSGVGDVSGVTITGDFGSVGTGFQPGERYPVAAVIAAPPGRVRIACGSSDTNSKDEPIEFVDPNGVWHDERLTCVDEGTPWHQRPVAWFYSDVNQLSKVLPRVIPGLLAADELSYGNYPSGEFGSDRYRLVRGADVVATFTLHHYDERAFILDLVSCDDSGIGARDRSTVGTPATPFELPTWHRCDPYEVTCASVFATASAYAAARGELPKSYVHPESPWDACTPEQPQGCTEDPDKYALELHMSPVDAQKFVASNGCGTREDPCSEPIFS